MKQSLALALSLLVLSACSASDTESQAVLPETALASFSINTHGSPDVAASREAMDVLTNAESRAVLASRTSLDAAEAGAQAALAAADGLSPNGASELRQTVASAMIQRHLAAATPDMSAVGRYTQILLDEQSPNAHLLAQALPALKPTWGEARVHAAAERASTEGAAYLVKTCPTCNARALAAARTELGREAADGAGEQQRAIQDGIATLRNI